MGRVNIKRTKSKKNIRIVLNTIVPKPFLFILKQQISKSLNLSRYIICTYFLLFFNVYIMYVHQYKIINYKIIGIYQHRNLMY